MVTPGTDTPGFYAPATQRWYLKNSQSGGQPDSKFKWSVASVDPTALRPVVGDWDGDGIDGIGLFDPANSRWYLKQTPDNGTGQPDIKFKWSVGGCGGCTVIAGDWNNSGLDGIGFLDPATQTFYLKNETAQTSGQPDAIVQIPRCTVGTITGVVGDWDGSLGGPGVQGTTTGCYDAAAERWYVRNSNTSGGPDTQWRFFIPGANAISGDWDGMNGSSGGFFDPATFLWYQRNSTTNGGPDTVFKWQVNGGVMELVGDWDGL